MGAPPTILLENANFLSLQMSKKKYVFRYIKLNFPCYGGLKNH